MSNSSVCSILDMPDEILVMIIFHFNVRERLALANSCQRFNNLVFGDKELLRNLDFTRERYLIKESDIRQYFNNENTYKKILRINAEYMRVFSSLSTSIGKAINLVELNILGGLEFKSVEELSCFLKPLVHLKRLSVNWPSSSMLKDYDKHNWNQVLEEPLSRLTYLSLNIDCYSDEFLLILQLCQQLEGLRMLVSRESLRYGSPLHLKPMKLRNLKFIQLIGSADLGPLRGHIMSIIPNPAEWTDFYPTVPYYEVYLERNVEVCAELEQLKKQPLPESFSDFCNTGPIDEAWPLVREHLLSEVIRVTHENVPEKFCSLSWSPLSNIPPYLLEIDDAKKLLKDPRYQISCLNFRHLIEKNCDVHLLASAFPNLTTLFLTRISKGNSPEKTKPLHRCLRKKGSPALEEDNDASNTDSSFKMLVKNTPHLKVLEISPGCRENGAEYWDVGALNLISGWKNLTVICLYNVPITDGKFLIDIGKECKKLEEITLVNLSQIYNYESELLQMLQHCKNLRRLSILGMSLEHLSEMLNILSNCSRLAALSLETFIEESDPLELTLSVEKMLRQCQELNKFLTNIRSYQTYDVLRLAVERIISELNRPNFQFGEFHYDH